MTSQSYYKKCELGRQEVSVITVQRGFFFVCYLFSVLEGFDGGVFTLSLVFAPPRTLQPFERLQSRVKRQLLNSCESQQVDDRDTKEIFLAI